MASVTEGALSATTSTLAGVSIIAAACGGGCEGAGFSFPPLNPESRILLAVAGVALLVFDQIRSGHWALPSLQTLTGFWKLLPLVLAGGSFVMLAWLVATRNAFANPAPLKTGYCQVRTDGPSARSAGTYWILEGFKDSAASDGLDQDRNVYEPCVRRTGETMKIYRLTHVWQGVDPAKLDAAGHLAVHETDIVLVPGTSVNVTGELSGPVVENGSGQPLYYNVWAPIALPQTFTSDAAR